MEGGGRAFFAADWNGADHRPASLTSSKQLTSFSSTTYDSCSEHFASPTFQLSPFSPAAGGWNSDNTYPRQLADITADHKADIVGFAANGVWTSPALT
jgi:hypothetical protein